MDVNKLKPKPAMIKSFLRGAFIAANSVQAAITTYASNGNSIGFNKETLLGVLWTLGGVGVAMVQRYLDKNDPSFGKMTAPITLIAQAEIDKKTK